MFCENCGAPLPENETKCPACGKIHADEPQQAVDIDSAVGGNDEPRGFSNKRNVIIIAIAAAVLLAGGVGAAVGINAYNNSSENILSVAQRYLNEKNYEQAIIEYKRVLELDPTSIEAYLGLAQAYIAIGDIDSAIEILQKGVEVTGDGEIQRKLDELLKSMEEAVQTTAAITTTTVTEPVEEPAEQTQPEETDDGRVVYGDPDCLEIEQMISAYLRGEGEIDESRLENVTGLTIANTDDVYVRCGRKYGTVDISIDWEHDGIIENIKNDIPFIFNMPKLKELCLYNHPFSDMSPLKELTNLTTLNLWSLNNLDDITPMSSLTNLSKLDFRNCRNITDLTPLKELSNLTEIEMSCIGVTDITPLGNLTNLERLVLGGNDITDITPLENLTNLYRLDLGFTDITDITALAGLTNLTSLSLYGDNITELAPLLALTELEYLDLYRTDITDLSPLANHVNLNKLILENCDSLPQSEIDAFISSHPNCEVTY